MSEQTHIDGITPPAKKAKGKTALPADFGVTDDMRSWAKINTPGIDPYQTTQEFIDYAHGRDWRMADWIATWRNWMRKAAKESKGKSRFAGAEKPTTHTPLRVESSDVPQPCRWQQSVNKILLDVIMNVAYSGRKISAERMQMLVQKKREAGEKLARLYGDRPAPDDEYKKISKQAWEWLHKLAIAS